MHSSLRRSLVFLTVLSGCHSVPLRPDRAPAAARRPATSAEERWLLDYKTARQDPAKACELFKALAENPAFPAHEVAELRAVEVCPTDTFPDFEKSLLPSWLQPQVIDVLLKKASESADKKTEIDLAVEKSKQRIPQSEKIKWMNVAIHDSEELKLDSKELYTRLYNIAPRLDPQPDVKRDLAVADDWRFVRQFDKARDFYERVLQSPNFSVEDKIAALKGIRISYKNTRKNEQHLATAQRLIQFLQNARKNKLGNPRRITVALYDARVYRARQMWTLGQFKEAEQSLIKIEKKMKGQVSFAELYWLRARMCEEKNDLDGASGFIERSLKEHFNDSDLHDKVMWYKAWNERRRGHLDLAQAALREIDAKTQTDFVRQRALYWLGKVLSEAKQDEESKKVFTKLLDIDPLGYYGLLAHRELKQPISLPSPSPDKVEAPATTPVDEALADWLAKLDEKDALAAYLDLASQLYKRQSDASDAGWVKIFKNYARAGLYLRLFESLGNLTAEQRKNILEQHADLLFPQPWNEEISAASAQFGVQPELIDAIIRQESAFDPQARSLADAFGLMQLLPEVAENLSGKYKVAYKSMDDLFEPKTNITLGAAHLKELFQRQDGKFILAVASYNASETVIRNWVKTRYRNGPIEFIEDIPYEETRAYVRLVMRNFIFYKLLKSKSNSLEFPDWVLNI